jgi:DeoR/GlpR family transcriptional regulator of sugar metabolism
VADVKAHASGRPPADILGIHTKFGVRTFCRFAEISDFESLVTDTTAGIRGAPLRRLGPQVIRV